MTDVPKDTLNAGQKAASEYFFQFLFNDEKEMRIDGPGGVGKSYLMSHMIDKIIPTYHSTCELMDILPEYHDVQMSALTNKASEVLSNFTQRPVDTIHSFMNLSVFEDYSTGQSKVKPTKQWMVHEKKIIFIDEASMIDSPLDRYIQEGTHKCKIVYVGDDCQMAPIMEPISPIYTRDIPSFELTEPMRNTNPDVLALHKQLRHTVKTGEFMPIKMIPGILEHLDDDGMQKHLKKTFEQQTLESRILCYTNKRVIAYNDYIRDFRQLPPAYTEGELLINNTAVQLNRTMLSVEKEVTIARLRPIRVIEIEPGVNLDIQEVDLVGNYGDVYTNVKLPLDRDHFSQLVEYYRKKSAWSTYYELKKGYPDLRQRDAATVYKAQGSTHKTVYIDLNDISQCRNPNQAARMLYVALSRFSERGYCYGTLASKFGGIIQ